MEFSPNTMDMDLESSLGKLVQCRICHDEDEDTNMESPCLCSGTLKYAHRVCVQKWCNEKGDTICEICNQKFEPGYTAPPPPVQYGGTPFDFRGNFEIPTTTRDLHNFLYVAIVAPDGDFEPSGSDNGSGPSSRRLSGCGIVAVIFVTLLGLRLTLPIISSVAGDDTSTLSMLFTARVIGILLPIYLIVKALIAAIKHRRYEQEHQFSHDASDEENDLPQHQIQSRLIHVC